MAGFDCFQVKTGMTMTEKILARASEKTQLSPGDNVWVNVDTLMTHDVCGPGSIGIFKKEFGQNAKELHSYSALYGIWVNCFWLVLNWTVIIILTADCEAEILCWS